MSLRAVYAKLVTLSGKSVELEQDRRNVEHSVEAIAERLLQAPDPELERELAGLDTQLTSLKAQAEFNSRVQRNAETELQKRLPADITACERLYRHWLSHVKARGCWRWFSQARQASSRCVRQQQCWRRRLWTNGFGICGGCKDFLCLDPGTFPTESEKSANSERVFAHDPLYAPPKRSETVAVLLKRDRTPTLTMECAAEPGRAGGSRQKLRARRCELGSGSLPFNPISGTSYKGINLIPLMGRSWEDPRWMTYKQAQENLQTA